MNDLAAIAFAIAALAWAVAAWDIARKWVADRSAIVLQRRQQDYEQVVDEKLAEQSRSLAVNKLAIENLAKELNEESKALRAQQVGVIAGMQQRRVTR